MVLPTTLKTRGDLSWLDEQARMIRPFPQRSYLLFQSFTGDSDCPMFRSSISRNASGDITGCLKPIVCSGSDDGLVEAALI